MISCLASDYDRRLIDNEPLNGWHVNGHANRHRKGENSDGHPKENLQYFTCNFQDNVI